MSIFSFEECVTSIATDCICIIYLRSLKQGSEKRSTIQNFTFDIDVNIRSTHRISTMYLLGIHRCIHQFSPIVSFITHRFTVFTYNLERKIAGFRIHNVHWNVECLVRFNTGQKFVLIRFACCVNLDRFDVMVFHV